MVNVRELMNVFPDNNVESGHQEISHNYVWVTTNLYIDGGVWFHLAAGGDMM